MIVEALRFRCGRCGESLGSIGAPAARACSCRDLTERPGPHGTVVARSDEPVTIGHECEDAARIPLDEASVLDLLRRHFASSDSVSLQPLVAPGKEHAARRAHAFDLPSHERILALYDASTNPTGHDGWVVTTKRLCWKNAGEPAASLRWRDVDPDQIFMDGERLCLGAEVIAIRESDVREASSDAFLVLALSAMPKRPIASGSFAAVDPGSRIPAPQLPTPVQGSTTATSYPPNGALATCAGDGEGGVPTDAGSYFAYVSHARSMAPDCSCWRCHTPIYETSPQCAYCGAEPTDAGWSHTG